MLSHAAHIPRPTMDTWNYGSWNVGIGPGELTFSQLLGYILQHLVVSTVDMVSGSCGLFAGGPVVEGVASLLTCT